MKKPKNIDNAQIDDLDVQFLTLLATNEVQTGIFQTEYQRDLLSKDSRGFDLIDNQKYSINFFVEIEGMVFTYKPGQARMTYSSALAGISVASSALLSCLLF